MKCLIVAAGQGVRLRETFEFKPLTPLKGKALIEHVIERARSAGVDEFLVVSGYKGDELRRELDGMAARREVRIGHIVNDEWTRANGVSLLKARGHLDEPFLLSMCDHIVDPDMLRGLMLVPLEPGSVVLGVDYNIENPVNDPEDVTRVKSSDGRIEQIGKLIADFNCFDTGIFLCSTGIFDALEESQSAGDDSISGAMTILARRRQALTFDIQDRLWIDVDDPVAFAKAEALLDSGRL